MRQRFASFWRSNTVTIGIVIIVIAFGTILFLQAEATSKLQEQTKQQTQILSQLKGVTDQLNNGAKQRTQQIATLTAHIDCIVLFFSQPDRSSVSIADINTCTLQDTKTGATSSSTAPVSTAPQSVNSGASDTQTTTSGAATATTPTSSSTPSGGSSNSDSFLERVVVNPVKSIINAL